VISPLLFPEGKGGLPADLPRRAIEILDRVGDIRARGSDILPLCAGSRVAAQVGDFLHGDDGFVKSGRTLSFRLTGGREISRPDSAVGISLGGSFDLEIRNANEEFTDAAVRQRFEEVRESLPDIDPIDILAAAVLPQRKTILGVSTPLKAVVFGLPFSLRFGVLVADRGQLRAFAAGPFVKEISL
jgi:hypothetical protein